MKKWLLIIVPIVLVALLGAWFWSLASVPDEEQRGITLTVEKSGVEVRKPDTSNWEKAVNGMEVGEGWSVRTDGTGQATIAFFGQGESRLDSRTETVITRADIDAMNPAQANVEISVGMGRVWSRVLKLFDLDSSYAVRTSAVVATVRGTAFDVKANADGSAEVIVGGSAVDVRSPNGGTDAAQTAVAEGFGVVFRAGGEVGEVYRIPEDVRLAKWFRQNTEADDVFVVRERERRLQALRDLDGPKPDSVMSAVAKLSERLHLAVEGEGDAREALAQRYLARRYAHLIELVEQGKAGMAAQEFARLENYIRTELRGPDAAAERARIRVALQRVAFLVEDADPDSPLYAFKQRIENLTEALTESNKGSALYVRLLALGARLDEAKQFMLRGAYEEAGVALEGAGKGIDNAIREAEPVLPQLTPERRDAIRGTLAALRAREQALRERLEVALTPPPDELETATSTEDGLDENVTEDRVPPANNSTTNTSPPPEDQVPTQTTEPEFEAISLFVQPNPVRVGETANLIVTAYRADGSEQNVSTLATFTVQSDAIGTLNGPRFTARSSGNTVITARYEDNGQIRSASVMVATENETVLESLTILSTAGTSLKTGQSTNLVAQARYSNGYTEDVTAQTEFALTTGAGGLVGNVFTAEGTGSVTITGYFSKNGTSVDGLVNLTINR